MRSLRLAITILLSYSVTLCAMSVLKISDDERQAWHMFLLGIIGINYCLFMIRIGIRRGIFK
jgi:hypothetical protein